MSYVNSVSVSPKSITLKIGNWYYGASAEVFPSDADCTAVAWRSDNTSIASVNESSGYIYANAVGTTKIHATATDGSGCSDYLTVTVSDTVPVTSVTLAPTRLSIEIGQGKVLVPTVLPDNASNKTLDWKTSNDEVAIVRDGVITGVSDGTAIISATTTDGSNKIATCFVTVIPDILVSSISVSSNKTTLLPGESVRFNASVCPEDAANRTVTWSSDNTDVATVNPSNGIVLAQNPGATVIRAKAHDGSGVVGTCSISVSAIPVHHISISPKQITLAIGETAHINTKISPDNASNKTIIWTSSNTSVATVGTHTGIVTAKSNGTTTITARSVNSNKGDTCKITVDSREKVTVKKDSHSFYVKFADGKVWKNIGMDLSNRQENYNQMYPPKMRYENYDNLIYEEQRYFDNIYVEENGVMEYKTYSVKQIAYLYLLDPLGIEYYMRIHACHDKDTMSGEFLSYKDEVYEAIFGNSERLSGRFYFTVVDGKPQYGKYSGYKRMDVYSNAEVLFGFHTIINWDLGEFIKSVLQGLFDWAMEDSVVGKGIQAYQILFHAGGILGACSDHASSYVTNYINEGIEDNIKEKFGEKVLKTCHWALTLVYILADSALNAFSLPNPQDITIYDKIHAVPDFLTIFDGVDGEWSIKDIIDQVNRN